MKNFGLIILLLFLSGCGYSSIYKNQNSINFQMNIIEAKGDSQLNNLIKNQIKLYSIPNSKNIYNLKVDTSFSKKVLTKDSSGVITDYNLSVVFAVNFKNKTETFKFDENINIKTQTDTFEQIIYEKNIKRNFASSIREKLVTSILSLNDN